MDNASTHTNPRAHGAPDNLIDNPLDKPKPKAPELITNPLDKPDAGDNLITNPLDKPGSRDNLIDNPIDKP
jgi:hypothetical protein